VKLRIVSYWEHLWQWWLWYGLDSKSIHTSGVKKCTSLALLRSTLALEGVEVIKVQRLWPWQRHWPKRIDHEHLQALLGQWAQLLSSGLPLLSCITLVHLQQASGRLRYELIQIQNALLSGVSFSNSLSQSRLFPTTIVHLVAAGEASGELATLLAQVHEKQVQQANLKRRFKRSLFMPLITLFSGLMGSLVIIYWVVPQVANLYTSGNYELPMLTQWLLGLSDMAQASIGAISVGLICTYISLVWLWSKANLRVKLEWVLLHIPGLGELMRLHSKADVFLVLSLTFNAGVPLLDCLALAANSSRWEIMSRDLNASILGLQQGQKLSQILTKMSWSAQTLQLIRIGEVAGDLGLSFTQLQHYYEAQVVSKSQWLEQLLEPALLILIAGFVGLILVALYLPLFQMGQMM